MTPAPVCGDGTDYTNKCEATKAGAQKIADGKCETSEQGCTKDLKPVCGDGKDYNNPCEAKKAGAAKVVDGKCASFCTRMYKPVCGDGKDYANKCEATKAGAQELAEGKCGTSDEKACPEDYKPVCGKNDKTYNNECEAKKAEMSYTDGKCEDEVCSKEVEPVCGKDGKQYNNACEAKKAKMPYEDGKCGTADDVCPTVKEPVCGTDGKTYDNACEAKKAGVRSKDGACTFANPCAAQCGRSYDPVCSVDGDVFNSACLAKCKKAEVSTTMKFVKGACTEGDGGSEEVCPTTSEPVCAKGKTYTNACEAKKAKVWFTKGECKERTCEAEECGEDGKTDVCGEDGKTYCNKGQAICAGVRAKPGACTKNEECTCPEIKDASQAVCGDGTSYRSECQAKCAGAVTIAEGKCTCKRCAQERCAEDCAGKCVQPRENVGIFSKCYQTCPKPTCVVDAEAKKCAAVEVAGGAKVEKQDGWMGRDKCDNECKCDEGKLFCSKKACAAETEKPASAQYCKLSDGSLRKPGWSGNGVEDNHCNKCTCAAAKEGAPVLRCTKRACKPIKGDAEVAEKEEAVAVWGAKQSWAKCQSKLRCKEELATCNECGFAVDASDDVTTAETFEYCQATCSRLQGVKANAEKRETLDTFGATWAVKSSVRDAVVVDTTTGKSADGLSKTAAGIKAKCAEHTKDCRDDDEECACPSSVSTFLTGISKARGNATEVKASFERDSKKVACCRETGGKSTKEIETEMMTKIQEYASAARSVVAGLEGQLAKCEADTEDADAEVCDTLELAMQASEGEVKSYSALMSASKALLPTLTNLTNIIDGTAGASPVMAAAVTVAAGVVAAALL